MWGFVRGITLEVPSAMLMLQHAYGGMVRPEPIEAEDPLGAEPVGEYERKTQVHGSMRGGTPRCHCLRVYHWGYPAV